MHDLREGNLADLYGEVDVISHQGEPMNAISISLGAFFKQVIEVKAVFLGKKDIFSAVSS